MRETFLVSRLHGRKDHLSYFLLLHMLFLPVRVIMALFLAWDRRDHLANDCDRCGGFVWCRPDLLMVMVMVTWCKLKFTAIATCSSLSVNLVNFSLLDVKTHEAEMVDSKDS